MKSIFAYSLLIALLLLPALSFVLWQRQPEQKLNIAIIDKTIRPTGQTKHASIAWILKHNNYRKSNGQLYNASTDYLGLFPRHDGSNDFSINDLEHSSIARIDSTAHSLTVLYCADTYGTYYNDWYLDSAKTPIPQKLYGGLAGEDLYLIEQMKKKGKLIIAEHGMLSPPTDPKIRKLAEQELGIQWSGWAGCYFSSLDTAQNKEIPQWAVILHARQYIGGWNYRHAGIILVHESGKIVILEETKELARGVPTISATKYCRKEYNTTGSVHFPHWFEISAPTSSQHNIIAHFRLHTNPIGDSLLKIHNIPTLFPAVIEHTGTYWMHYYAGDFSALTIGHTSSMFYGIEKIGAILYDDADHSGEKFFWTFYRPLLSTILQRHTDHIHDTQPDSLGINTPAL
jgi:hypothetical protein